MPVDLRKAHNELDKAVDKAYRSKPFATELERIQFLFERYQKLTEPLSRFTSSIVPLCRNSCIGCCWLNLESSAKFCSIFLLSSV